MTSLCAVSPADEDEGGTELQIDVKLIGPEGKQQSALHKGGDISVSDWSRQTPHDVEDDVFTVGVFIRHTAPCSAG